MLNPPRNVARILGIWAGGGGEAPGSQISGSFCEYHAITGIYNTTLQVVKPYPATRDRGRLHGREADLGGHSQRASIDARAAG